VSVTAREDVPPFGPPLPNPAVFKKVSKRERELQKKIQKERDGRRGIKDTGRARVHVSHCYVQ
jgi:hypothetical protein